MAGCPGLGGEGRGRTVLVPGLLRGQRSGPIPRLSLMSTRAVTSLHTGDWELDCVQ